MKITQIRKRDGNLDSFELRKITRAIFKAMEATSLGKKKDAEKISKNVENYFLQKAENNNKYIPAVEEIQDTVEQKLMEDGFYKVAKAYILYRDQKIQIRAIENKLSNGLVDQYLEKLDWQVKENSNMAFSLQGMRNYISSEVSKRYWLNRIYPPEIRKAHQNGDFHIHDLDSISVYCVGWDLADLLHQGFTGVRGKISCSPPKHFSSALGQAVNFIFTLQGEAAGAQAFSSFDTLLAPFVRYDNLSYKEVKQHIQTFVFNMNVPTRVGFQTPFSNITMDMVVPKTYQKLPVIIGGKPQKETYAEFQAEMDMINKAFLEVMTEGDASGRVFTFPIPTYNITKDFDWDNKNLDILWEMTAKYGIPYFANFVNSDMSPDDARSMCPLAGDEKVLIKSSRGWDIEYGDIRNIYEGSSSQEEYEIYSDGKFITGKFNKFSNQKMLKVVLENGHELKITDKHLNFVLKNENKKVEEIQGQELKKGMYLPYSLKEFKGDGGIEDLGYFVGAYAGDGSFDRETSVVFSLEEHFKKEIITKLQTISLKYFGTSGVVTRSKKSKLVTLRINSRGAVGFCKDFIAGKERNKHYKAKLFTKSLEFRKAVLAGHYDTDGGNRNRIYTSSKKMINSLNMLAATLGTTTSIYKDDREGRFGTEPNYAVLVYQLNRKKYGDLWFKKHQKLWMKIKEVKPISNNTAYCFEVKNGEPVFTVGTTGILTHNCRLRIDNRQLRKRGGGLFGANPLTGSIGVVTINLPRIGKTSQTEEEIFQKIDKLMDLAKNSLETKRELLESLTNKGLYPYTSFYLKKIKDQFDQYWVNHFSTIGLLGMNELLLNFNGETVGSKKGKELTEKILEHMRERLIKYQEETGNNYNLEATPGEGTTYRFANLDKKVFKDMIFANGECKNKEIPYYTNSSHLPVNFSDDIFEILDLQDKAQTQYTGGTVIHFFIGEQIKDPQVVKNLVKKITDNYELPYFSITPTFSVCNNHGYLVGEQQTCPDCGEKCEIYSRIVGYLRPVEQWNDAKAQEYAHRKQVPEKNLKTCG